MSSGNFQKNLPAVVAENAAPDLIEADRDDRRRQSLDDLLEAAVERQQEAVCVKRPSAKMHTSSPPARASLAARSDLTMARGPLAAVDGDHRPSAAGDGTAHILAKAAQMTKADETPLRRQKQQPIDVADVVADQQHSAGLRHILQTDHTDPVDGVRQQPQQGAHKGHRPAPQRSDEQHDPNDNGGVGK